MYSQRSILPEWEWRVSGARSGSRRQGKHRRGCCNNTDTVSGPTRAASSLRRRPSVSEEHFPGVRRINLTPTQPGRTDGGQARTRRATDRRLLLPNRRLPLPQQTATPASTDGYSCLTDGYSCLNKRLLLPKQTATSAQTDRYPCLNRRIFLPKQTATPD